MEQMKLPNMNEFSPGIVDSLGPLLEIVAQNAGSRNDISTAIAMQYPLIAATSDERQRFKRAQNVQIGMSQCGLFDLQANQLTPFGQELMRLPPEQQHRQFAAHLLKECRGEELLDAVRSLQARRLRLTNDVIRQELRERGFQITTNEGNVSKVRMWLEKPGLIDSNWNIDEDLVGQLLGIEDASRREWVQFTRSQRMLLLVLRDLAIDDNSWLSGSHLKKVIISRYGLGALPEGNFRAAVLNPIREVGWIETRGERREGGGRGGNMGELRATAKLLTITAELGLDHQTQGLPPEVLAQLDRSSDDLLADIDGTNTHLKGLALEVLAVRLTRQIGLRPIRFRLRAATTGGNEVDLIADGLHLHYSRWLIQCKATQSQVSTDVLAREIGMATLLKADVIVMISTGGFSEPLRQYADQVEQATALQVVLIDGTSLRRILAQGPELLVDLLQEQADEAQRLKCSQVLGTDGTEGT